MPEKAAGLSFEDFKKEVINDYKTVCISRNISLLARKEMPNDKAKAGILGDGKEVAQLAMAKQFQQGDKQSAYYPDPTFMLATGMGSLKDFFAMLHAEGGKEKDPDEMPLSQSICTELMPLLMSRLVDISRVSKLNRENAGVKNGKGHSCNGNEVAFGTIGAAGASAGWFFESLNKACVCQVPMAVSVLDDGCVNSGQEIVKGSISKALKGFEKGPRDKTGMLIFNAKGWDYAGLCQMYEEGIRRCRREHVPVLFHVEELTRPGEYPNDDSHYSINSAERLGWEKDFDCIAQMRKWLIERHLATEEDLCQLEEEVLQEVQLH